MGMYKEIHQELHNTFRRGRIYAFLTGMEKLGNKKFGFPVVWAINEDPDEFSRGNKKNEFNTRMFDIPLTIQLIQENVRHNMFGQHSWLWRKLINIKNNKVSFGTIKRRICKK